MKKGWKGRGSSDALWVSDDGKRRSEGREGKEQNSQTETGGGCTDGTTESWERRSVREKTLQRKRIAVGTQCASHPVAPPLLADPPPLYG